MLNGRLHHARHSRVYNTQRRQGAAIVCALLTELWHPSYIYPGGGQRTVLVQPRNNSLLINNMSLNNDNTPDRAQDADVDDLELQLALELSLIQGPYDQGSLDSIPSAALNYQSNTQNSLMQDLEAVREFYLCSDAENLPEDEETLQVLGWWMLFCRM